MAILRYKKIDPVCIFVSRKKVNIFFGKNKIKD